MTNESRELSLSSRPAPAGNLSTGLLKLIALVFMFIDHSGKVLFNNCYEMRLLGRIAFPVYIWCMIVGFHRTRSVPFRRIHSLRVRKCPVRSFSEKAEYFPDAFPGAGRAVGNP